MDGKTKKADKKPDLMMDALKLVTRLKLLITSQRERCRRSHKKCAMSTKFSKGLSDVRNDISKCANQYLFGTVGRYDFKDGPECILMTIEDAFNMISRISFEATMKCGGNYDVMEIMKEFTKNE